MSSQDEGDREYDGQGVSVWGTCERDNDHRSFEAAKDNGQVMWAYQVEPHTKSLFNRPYVVDLLKRAQAREDRGLRTIGRIDKPMNGGYNRAWYAEHSWRWIEHVCPYCDADIGKGCVKAGGTKAKKIHEGRIRMALEAIIDE